MKLWEKLRQKLRGKLRGKLIYPRQQKTDPLLEEAEAARREWQIALQQINQITSTTMLDHIIYKINSTERKLVALLKQAKEEGVSAWPGELYKLHTLPKEEASAQ